MVDLYEPVNRRRWSRGPGRENVDHVEYNTAFGWDSAQFVITWSALRLLGQMSQASGSTEELTSPSNSQRSLASSDFLGDGRPEVAATKLLRSTSFIKRRKSKGISPLNAPATPDYNDDDDDDEGLLILNQPSSFGFRSFFQRGKSTPVLQRSNTLGAKASDTGGTTRRMRAHEELCLLLPKRSGKGGNLRKAWFMSAGLIGRESGENILIATKDASMDPIHAEISLDGDDYLLRDLKSSSGTYLCLSTTNRHHPQRDGYRLRIGDTVVMGLGATIVVEDFQVGDKPVQNTTKSQSLQAKLDRRLTDHLALERSSNHLRQTSTFSSSGPKKTVHFAEILNATKKDPDAEPMLTTVDGNDYPLGSRYKRKTLKPHEHAYSDLVPVSLKLSISTPECSNESTFLSLPPKMEYTIGSSPWCDIQVVSDSIYAVHARIVFDGHFFVLQDMSFEDNPKRKTRVLLTRATRIGRGDWVLFGKCALTVVNVYRAFREHEPDLKEVIFKCQLLRTSKRKSRRRESFLPVGFKHAHPEPFVIGKGQMCEGQLLTATLTVEQFLFQLDHGQCSLTPRFGGINQGMYFLLGRDAIAHENTYKDDVIRYTSKALMLVEGSIFRVGSTELEVTFVKLEDPGEAVTRMDEIEDNTQLLKTMPWLQQISFDRHCMENVARRAQRLDLEAGDSVYDEGDPASFLFVVIDGEIELETCVKTTRRGFGGSSGHGHQGSRRNTNSLPTPESAVIGAMEKEFTVEKVTGGSYFGEASLWGGELDYSESAKALTSCQLLVLSREDVCGYLSYYMDIIRPHLSYESHKDLLRKMRVCLPFCGGISYHELRFVAAEAERIYFHQDDWIIRNGEFVHKGKRRFGALLIRYGTVDVVTPAGVPIHVPRQTDSTVLPGHEEDEHEAESKLDDESRSAEATTQSSPSKRLTPVDQRQTWAMDTPLMLLPDGSPLHHNLKARAGVQCFFIDLSAFNDLVKQNETRNDTGTVHTVKRVALTPNGTPSLLQRRSTNRRSSCGTQFKARHSQVFTTALRANTAEESDNLIENADLEDANDPSRKWRRKKRNKNLLEKTIVDTQQNPELFNTLVLYVLSGANRGDIHVVHNVATIGSIVSGADIELNDQYVSNRQAVIEHREGRYWLYDTFSEWGTYVRLEDNQTVQVYPGDVFLAGEVEFTCMGSFPVRKKTSLCCVQ